MPYYLVQPWGRDRYRQATVTSSHDTAEGLAVSDKEDPFSALRHAEVGGIALDRTKHVVLGGSHSVDLFPYPRDRLAPKHHRQARYVFHHKILGLQPLNDG